MKSRFMVLSVLLVSIFYSCGYKSMDETNGNAGQSTVFPAAGNQQEQANVLPVQSSDSSQVLQTQQVIPVNANVQPTASGNLNPAHGAPGHRCDIAVGAPLNSKPAPSNNQAVPNVVTTTPVTVQPQQPVNKVAPGMNPEHGQPGHRCDISVGAPLNSPAPVPVKSNPTTPYPVIVDSSKN